MADANLEKELDSLKADMAGIRSEISSLLGSIKERGSAAAGGMRSQFETVDERVREQVDELMEEAWKLGKESMDTVEQHVEEHPFLTVAAAFGLGFLLSSLLRR
jgi:ElaB/YqjD/DUF883 family membrane-anchored ribosome-binding protein